MDIAQKLGYISVVETLKVVTETVITTTHTITIEEKYRVQAPESMQETFMSDSEDEGGKSLLTNYFFLFGECERIVCTALLSRLYNVRRSIYT